MRIVPFYAAILALFFVALSLRTIGLRRRLRIGVGDAGDERMLRAMRAHSNFAEYVPLALLVFFFVETAGATIPLVHGLCACLVVGRVVHAVGVSQVPEPRGLRQAGMALTFTPIIVAALRLLAACFAHA